mmetsp:Transcript_12549/g.25040  ORF Transcript_12549/g.25040 Transcript_12549/m.25040 type:complete len:282 (+) Transcript_12549:115-960(+)
MDSNDLDISGPTGLIESSYASLKEIPEEVFTFSQTLMTLKLSHNKLTKIPSQICDFAVLQTLNVSHNNIELIDPNIGKCIRLRHLNVISNRLSSLPDDICNCEMLDTLKCSENHLQTIPQNLSRLKNLNLLDLRNNKLSDIPLGLSQIPTLKEIFCSGNDRLLTVPPSVRDHSEVVISMMQHQFYLRGREQSSEDSYYQLKEEAEQKEELRFHLNEDLFRLEREVEALKKIRPEKYIQRKKKLYRYVNIAQERVKSIKRRYLKREGSGVVKICTSNSKGDE